MLNDFLLAFIPIFVAMDAVGIMPVFVGLTHDLTKEEKRKIVVQSLATATCLAVGFIFLGKFIFRLLGITIGDFMIAGGVILLCISIMDLLTSGEHGRKMGGDLGVVPIGTPLVVGPGVLTSSLMMIDLHGLAVTLAAVLVNIFIVGLVFLNSENLHKALGEAGSRALSKVMSLLLAAISVMMIRKGIIEVLMI